MPGPIIIKKGGSLKLPAKQFTGGVGWDDGDVDLWFLRRKGGVYTPVAWLNKDWQRPDLGFNEDPETHEKYPFIAPPELDIVHEGDDRRGKTSAGGYDEKFKLDLSLSPADVDQYIALVGIAIDEPAQDNPTLLVAGNIVCGIKDLSGGPEVQINVGGELGYFPCGKIAEWNRTPNGMWEFKNEPEGYDQDIQTTVQTKFGVVYPESWAN